MKRLKNEGRADAAGYSMIEVLIALAVLSVGMAAVTTAVISASGTSRTTTRADMGIMWGQEVMEQMAGISLEAPGMSVGARAIRTGNGKIEIVVFDPVDENGDGRDDYKTIVTRVFVEKGGVDELRMENFLRRSVQ